MEREVIRRRNLPHWDVPGAAYFVTTCLEGSIPAQGLLDIAAYRRELASQPKRLGLTDSELKRRQSKLAFARTDRWLDESPAVRWLEAPELAWIVADAFFYHAGSKYDLLGFVVMPSHLQIGSGWHARHICSHLAIWCYGVWVLA